MIKVRTYILDVQTFDVQRRAIFCFFLNKRFKFKVNNFHVGNKKLGGTDLNRDSKIRKIIVERWLKWIRFFFFFFLWNRQQNICKLIVSFD